MYQDTLLAEQFFGNSIQQWLVAIATFVVVYFALKIFKRYILKRLEKWAQATKNEFDDVFVNGLEAIHWPFNVFIALYVAQLMVALNSTFERAMYYILIITVTYYGIRVLQEAVDVLLQHFMHVKKDDKKAKEGLKLFSTIIKVGLWVLALLLILSNLGYNVTSLVTGLGIGGIIVAFAVQNIVADLFSSLSIYFDKPFSPGDFVIVGEHMGTVKHVGMRSTRIQSLSGEELVVPNGEVTATTIKNYGRMQRRRVAFDIGVIYGTPTAKLKKIPDIVQGIIEKQAEVNFDRAHFKSFGDFSLNFEIVYYVEGSDYLKYMNVQQEINLALVGAFEKEGIEFAFPTQTIHVEKS